MIFPIISAYSLFLHNYFGVIIPLSLGLSCHELNAE